MSARERRHRPREQGVTIKIATPTLDKMLAVKGESQSIGNFLNWLSEQGYLLCKYSTERRMRDVLVPDRKTIEQQLADYFDIDLAAAERERQKILKGLRI